MTTQSHVRMSSSMPEEERSGLYDRDEEYAWDCDLQWPLDEELGGDDEDGDE